MKYNFSANFLKILPPDTNFGQAWETICDTLLRAEFNDNSQIRLKAPDKGIDIYSQKLKNAYQCKSSELAIHGNIDATECIASIKSALAVKDLISWNNYFIASNANFTGSAFQRLQEYIKNESLNCEILGPTYWSDLAEKYIDKITQYLDYRLIVTEQEVIEAFKKARYYDQYVQKYSEEISTEKYIVEVSNNRTPIRLKIPFSPNLTIENLLDVVKTILGINMDRNNFYDIKTSALPSISLTFEQIKQGFSKKIGEVVNEKEPKFEFWITIIWKDETEKSVNDDDTKYLKNLNDILYCRNIEFKTYSRESLSFEERKNLTIRRTEELLQNFMWESILGKVRAIYELTERIEIIKESINKADSIKERERLEQELSLLKDYIKQNLKPYYQQNGKIKNNTFKDIFDDFKSLLGET